MNVAANEAAAYARFAERVRDEGLLSDPCSTASRASPPRR